MKQFDSLATGRSWTTLLKTLPEDKPTRVTFPDVDAVKACRSVAYQPYGDLRNWCFSFKQTEEPLTFTILKARS